MRCRCGYAFHEHALDEPRPYLSFATVNDAEYRKFMKWEVKAWTADDKKARSKAIGKAAQFVGSIMICPECGRLVWNRPDRDELEFFVQEASDEP